MVCFSSKSATCSVCIHTTNTQELAFRVCIHTTNTGEPAFSYALLPHQIFKHGIQVSMFYPKRPVSGHFGRPFLFEILLHRVLRPLLQELGVLFCGPLVLQSQSCQRTPKPWVVKKSLGTILGHWYWVVKKSLDTILGQWYSNDTLIFEFVWDFRSNDQTANWEGFSRTIHPQNKKQTSLIKC